MRHVDEIDIRVKSGRGGNGKISFLPGRHGPDGGDGGTGGDVYIVYDPHLSSLRPFIGKRVFKAEDGQPGKSNWQKGSNGKDVEVRVPNNTRCVDKESGESFEISPDNPRVLLCKGGRGGWGNDRFKSPTYRTPRKANPGNPGEVKTFRLILTIIADYGLVGLPNAGKSSLLNELTAAGVPTAAYPFTTLYPNLGVLGSKVIADIPGLIEGASQGKGLGFRFLKHIEKVRLIVYCIASNSSDIMSEYKTVQKEMNEFSTVLTQKESIILLTKHDEVDSKTLNERVRIMKKINPEVYPVSIHDLDSIEKLRSILISR